MSCEGWTMQPCFTHSSGWTMYKPNWPPLNMWTFSPSPTDKNLRTPWSSNSTSEDIPRRIEGTLWKRYLYTHIYSSIIRNNWSLRAIHVPTDWEIDEPMWQTQIIEYYLPLKRKWILTHTTTWRNLVDILLSDINLTEKTNILWFPLNGVSGVVRFIKTERRRVISRNQWRRNSSVGIPSPPPALFVVMLPMAHFTSHSRMSGSSWVDHTIMVVWVIKVFLV